MSSDVDGAGPAEALVSWRNDLIARYRAEHGIRSEWLGMPDAWWGAHTWACAAGHVSTMLLGTEEGNVCMACGGQVWLVPPGTDAEQVRQVLSR